MSLDSSLKVGGGLAGHRNVLTRAERIAKLQELGEFKDEESNALGLRKVGNRKVVAGGKSKKKKKDEEATE
ncbi:MAG: small basic protein [Phycisphaeraceae bacterium]|jgi:small basic protein (TIGR04137 family)